MDRPIARFQTQVQSNSPGLGQLLRRRLHHGAEIIGGDSDGPQRRQAVHDGVVGHFRFGGHFKREDVATQIQSERHTVGTDNPLRTGGQSDARTGHREGNAGQHEGQIGAKSPDVLQEAGQLHRAFPHPLLERKNPVQMRIMANHFHIHRSRDQANLRRGIGFPQGSEHRCRADHVAHLVLLANHQNSIRPQFQKLRRGQRRTTHQRSRQADHDFLHSPGEIPSHISPISHGTPFAMRSTKR